MSKLNFAWTYEADPKYPHAYFRLYENGLMVVDNIGELNFSLLMDGKGYADYKYSVTTFDPDSMLESVHSNEVPYHFFPPAAPAGLSVSLAQ